MKLALLGIVFAFALHAGFLLFGGLLFPSAKKDQDKLQEVELLSSDDEKPEEKKKDEKEPESKEKLETEDEKPPDATELTRNLDLSPLADAPALEESSLAAIEQALNGGAAGGDFADALSFSSGGRIGGMGSANALDEKGEGVFSMAEIDQPPRAVNQIAPQFPSEMRGKKIEGVVTFIFVVDASGKVTSPRVEKSSHPAFEKPALDALKQWRFDPAVKGGKRVRSKMRETIRFQQN